jgi:hypothetical protein
VEVLLGSKGFNATDTSLFSTGPSEQLLDRAKMGLLKKISEV